jgi:hypothetical protein
MDANEHEWTELSHGTLRGRTLLRAPGRWKNPATELKDERGAGAARSISRVHVVRRPPVSGLPEFFSLYPAATHSYMDAGIVSFSRLSLAIPRL